MSSSEYYSSNDINEFLINAQRASDEVKKDIENLLGFIDQFNRELENVGGASLSNVQRNQSTSYFSRLQEEIEEIQELSDNVQSRIDSLFSEVNNLTRSFSRLVTPSREDEESKLDQSINERLLQITQEQTDLTLFSEQITERLETLKERVEPWIEWIARGDDLIDPINFTYAI